MDEAMTNIKILFGDEEPIGDLGNISVRKKYLQDVGSCNACTNHKNDLFVYEIQLRNISVRVCPKCRRLLLQELKNA